MRNDVWIGGGSPRGISSLQRIVKILGISMPVPFFHQQAIEKGLKALYIHKNRTTSGKTHSLIYLALETDTPTEFHSFLRRLAPEFVTTRYPDASYGTPFEIYDNEIATELLEKKSGSDGMVEITDERVNEWINHFLQVLKEKYSPETILIFGSRARGDHLLESNVDMIIISNKFEGTNWLDRIREVSDLSEGLVVLEALCYTPQEFEIKKNEIGIVSQAVKEGLKLEV